jgi:hypothetical protein
LLEKKYISSGDAAAASPGDILSLPARIEKPFVDSCVKVFSLLENTKIMLSADSTSRWLVVSFIHEEQSRCAVLATVSLFLDNDTLLFVLWHESRMMADSISMSEERCFICVHYLLLKI